MLTCVCSLSKMKLYWWLWCREMRIHNKSKSQRLLNFVFISFIVLFTAYESTKKTFFFYFVFGCESDSREQKKQKKHKNHVNAGIFLLILSAHLCDLQHHRQQTTLKCILFQLCVYGVTLVRVEQNNNIQHTKCILILNCLDMLSTLSRCRFCFSFYFLYFVLF